jgi:hypothetical protein
MFCFPSVSFVAETMSTGLPNIWKHGWDTMVPGLPTFGSLARTQCSRNNSLFAQGFIWTELEKVRSRDSEDHLP